MVRINLINPKNLTDQHLIAEYNEMLMLIGYVKKFPEINKIPSEYVLGEGHIKFFKNKLVYIQERHEIIKTEMNKRGFKTEKKISLKEFNDELKNNWSASKKDKEIIKKRLKDKLIKKPDFYRYYSEKKPLKFYIELIEKAD